MPVFSLTGVDRMIVVAAHPDDETLGAGALIASARARGIPTSVIVVTDGAASHPGSPSVAAAALAATRAAEVQAALHLLNPDATLTLLGFPDGRVRENRTAIAAALRPLLSST
ncbi:SAM-dependent methyltransferase, partial [Subtercola sp. Z020]